MSVLLNFSEEEESMLKETLEYKVRLDLNFQELFTCTYITGELFVKLLLKLLKLPAEFLLLFLMKLLSNDSYIHQYTTM